MPTLETIIIVTLAGLALSASPGPSMLYVLSRSIGQSKGAGYASAGGLAAGGMLLALAAALGLSALFATWTIAYTVVEVGGAAYLCYLGIDMIASESESMNTLEKVRRSSLWRTFYQGVAVEVFNPKTILFFIAFIPQFVEAEVGSVTLQMLVLGILVPLTAIPSDIIVATMGGSLAGLISAHRTGQTILKWVGGLFLIGLAARILIG
jgi:threonine/homoserine/homoserine lactone efflux protein